MKNLFRILIILIFLTAVSCTSGPNFSDVLGREWKLVEVHLSGKNIDFDRNALIGEGFGDIFTLNFDASRISGTGAPNRYSAPYTANRDLAIKVSQIAGTLMAPLRQPEKLKEADYFKYIENTSKWNLVGGKLQLTSKTADNTDVTLVFSLGDAKAK